MRDNNDFKVGDKVFYYDGLSLNMSKIINIYSSKHKVPVKRVVLSDGYEACTFYLIHYTRVDALLYGLKEDNND